MFATIEQHENFKSKRTDRFEEDADILIAEQRLKNPIEKENLIPFEKVLAKFNISQKEIDNVEEVEFE